MNHKKTIVSIALVAVSLCYGAVLNACYIDLSAKDIEPYIGSNIKYYKEHKAEVFGKGNTTSVGFSIERCKELPLERVEEVTWFFSSAVERFPLYGRAIQILNPCLTNVYVVRGKTPFGHIQIYFGCDVSKSTFSNTKWTVYQGNVLYIHALSKKDAAITHVHFSKDACYLSNATITKEIRKYTDDDCNSLEYRQVYEDLFCQKDGYLHTLSGCLVSSVCYWAHKERELQEVEGDQK